MTKIAAIDKKIITKIGDQLPRFLKEKETDLIPLLQAYYRWCDLTDQVQHQIYTFENQVSSRTADDVFVEFLLEQFNKCLPQNALIDKRVFIEHAIEFYRLKGTEEGIRLFFRMIYGIEPDVIYPKDFILRTSDGIWIKKTFLKINFVGNPAAATAFVGKQILGQRSNATAIVEAVTTETVGSNNIAELTISSIRGTFTDDEIVTAIGTEEVIEGRVYTTVVAVQVDTAAIANHPSPTLFQVGDTIGNDLTDTHGFTPATSAYNTGLKLRIVEVDNPDINGFGTAAKVEIVNTGIQNYSQPPVANIVPANSIVCFVGTNRTTDGFYQGERGHVSSRAAVLQDGKIFQEYSYIIRSTKPFTEYKNPLLCMVHPAGFQVSAEYLIDSDINDIAGRSILFHLSHTGQPETSELNYKLPGGKSPSRFVEPEIVLNTGPETIQELLDRLTAQDPLWFENPNNLNRDFSRHIKDYLNIPIGSYLYNMLPQDAYIPVEVMQLHDTFTDVQKDLETRVFRFDRRVGYSLNRYFVDHVPIASMPESLEVGLFYEQTLGDFWAMPDPQYRVYSYLTLNNCSYLITEQGDTFLLEDGSVLCLGNVPLPEILLNEDNTDFNTEDGGTPIINNV